MEKPNKDFSVAILDGDIIAYRVSVASQDDNPEVCATRLDDLVGYCLDETVGFTMEGNYEVHLTGSNNFRYDIAKTYHYKGNRKDTEKPEHLEFARGYLVENWGATISEGCEADDNITISAVGYGDDAVIVSQDKDFNTVPGWKFNFVNGNWRYDTEESARRFFYTQVLTGDAVDNIVGLHRVGPVKAGKILEGLTTEEDMWEACLKAYATSRYEATMVNPEDRQEWAVERVLENARLLHLQRYNGELWEPPNGKTKEDT